MSRRRAIERRVAAGFIDSYVLHRAVTANPYPQLDDAVNAVGLCLPWMGGSGLAGSPEASWSSPAPPDPAGCPSPAGPRNSLPILPLEEAGTPDIPMPLPDMAVWPFRLARPIHWPLVPRLRQPRPWAKARPGFARAPPRQWTNGSSPLRQLRSAIVGLAQSPAAQPKSSRQSMAIGDEWVQTRPCPKLRPVRDAARRLAGLSAPVRAGSA